MAAPSAELLEQYSDCPARLLQCPREGCITFALPRLTKNIPKQEWCIQLTCSCYESWFICKHCPMGSKKHMKKKHIAKHGKFKAHTKAMSKLNQQVKVGNVRHTKINVDDEVDYGERHDGEWEYDDDVMTTADLAHSGFTLSDPLFECSNFNSSNYFRHDAVSGHGPSFLVSNGVFNNDHHVGMIDTREILYHIAILLFLMSLTLSQQQFFCGHYRLYCASCQ
jgi:hypothetical protein